MRIRRILRRRMDFSQIIIYNLGMDKYDVICIGTALLDSILRGFDPEPVSVSGFRAESGSVNVGGEAVNEASALAKLGVKTGILCYLGEDDAGVLIEKKLSEAGVDIGLIVREKEHPTPVTTMFVRENGTRMSVTNQAHKYNFHPEARGFEAMDAKAVLLGSLFRAPFDDPQVIHSVLTAAKAKGMTVFADTKIPNFHPLRLEDIAASLPLIDYITPNEDEGRYYTGKDQPEAMADVFLEYGISNVIIKLGGKGCFFRNREKSIRLDAFKIRAVDSTGAGDNFIAGFVSELLRGSTQDEALTFANACGAVCSTAVGACTALKGREQILEFLQEHGKA